MNKYIPHPNLIKKSMKSDEDIFMDNFNDVCDHLYMTATRYIVSEAVSEYFLEIGEAEDFVWDYIQHGYVVQISTGTVFNIRVLKTDEDFDFGFDFNGRGCEMSGALPEIHIKSLSNPNPKIYLQENTESFESIKSSGIPIHMSKPSKKFKSSPFIWASDIIKRAKSRI